MKPEINIDDINISTIKLLKMEVHNKLKIEIDRDVELNEEDTVFVNYKGVCHFIKIKDIILIESEGNYARIFFKNEYVVIYKSLNKIEKRLGSNVFFRANRHQILNLKMAERMVFEPDGIHIYLISGKNILMSRRQYVKFKSLKSF